MPNFYYVKSGGTATGDAGRFAVKQTGSFATLGAAAYYDNIAAALSATTPPAAGDSILVSSLHTHTYSAGTSLVIPTGVIVLSVADTAIDTYTAGAQENSSGSVYLNVKGDGIYVKGVSFGLTFNGGIGSNTGGTAIFEDLTLTDLNTGTAGGIELGTDNYAGNTVFRNVILDKRNATVAQMSLGPGFTVFEGGGFGSSVSSTLGFQCASNALYAIAADFVGFDMSTLDASADIFSVSTSAVPQIEFIDAKLPASWTGALISGALQKGGARISMRNCDDGNTNYHLWIEDYYGTITDETSNYLTGGASDGVTPIAHRMASNANAAIAGGGLRGETYLYLVSAAGTVNVSVEILSDGQLTDQDVALDVMYLGDAASSLATYVNTMSDPLTTPANLTAGAGTGAWASTAGLTTPTSSKLTKSVTVNQKGYLMAVVRLLKPSTTIFVNPQVA